ncbi:MAG: HNH endonuclease [bacterium]|nr:HNH endonuclease [bacterium]
MVPRASGGGNGVENLVALCWRCHGFVHEGGGATSDFVASGR